MTKRLSEMTREEFCEHREKVQAERYREWAEAAERAGVDLKHARFFRDHQLLLYRTVAGRGGDTWRCACREWEGDPRYHSIHLADEMSVFSFPVVQEN